MHPKGTACLRLKAEARCSFWRNLVWANCSECPLSRRPIKPLPEGLILTHIFFGSLVERDEMVEVVIQPAIRLGLIGHFTKSICKMWVRIRPSGTGRERPTLRGRDG